jgi:hypothetical protein
MFYHPPQVAPSITRAARTLLLASLMLGTSCGRFTRIRQCRALISRVNPSLDEISRLTQNKSDKATYLAAAARYEQLSVALGPLEFSDQQMAKDVAEYAGVLHVTAQTLKTLASAVETHNVGETERLARELDRLGGREHISISKMDSWCQPGA